MSVPKPIMAECTAKAEGLQDVSLIKSEDSDLALSIFIKVFDNNANLPTSVNESVAKAVNKLSYTDVSLVSNRTNKISVEQKCMSCCVEPNESRTYEEAVKEDTKKSVNNHNQIDCAPNKIDDTGNKKSVFPTDLSNGCIYKRKQNNIPKHQTTNELKKAISLSTELKTVCFIYLFVCTPASGLSSVNFSQNEYSVVKGEHLSIPWNGSWDDIVFINGVPIGHCNGKHDCNVYNETYQKYLALNKLVEGSYELEVYHVNCCYYYVSLEPTGLKEKCTTARIHVCGCQEQESKYDAQSCPFEMEKTMSEGSGCLLDFIPSVDCGGSVTNASGSISNSHVNQTMECIWVIQVAAGNSTNPNIISARLSMTGNTSTDNYLEVKDGATACASQYSPTLNRTILSRTNSLWLGYFYKAKSNTRPLNFTFTYTTYTCGMVCNNSQCMHPDWRCNGKNDCGDWSDEVNCFAPIPPNLDTKKDSNAGWFIFGFLMGIVLGIVLTVIATVTGFVPRCVRYFRRRQDRGPNSMSNDDPNSLEMMESIL